jgi:hypothetical protein
MINESSAAVVAVHEVFTPSVSAEDVDVRTLLPATLRETLPVGALMLVLVDVDETA